MTTVRRRVCANCNAEYTYISSGYASGAPDNDGTYCRTCKQAVNQVLAAIPKVAKEVHLLITGEEADRVIAAHKKNMEGSEGPFGFKMYPIGFPCFRVDAQTQKTKVVSRLYRVRVDGHSYLVTEGIEHGTSKVEKIMLKDSAGRHYSRG